MIIKYAISSACDKHFILKTVSYKLTWMWLENFQKLLNACVQILTDLEKESEKGSWLCLGIRENAGS